MSDLARKNHFSLKETRVTGQWTYKTLSLKVTFTSQGLLEIKTMKNRIPGQLFFWPDVEEPLPNLETLDPHGPQLAFELRQAFSGRPVDPQVPWRITGRDWYLEFYHQIRALPLGQLTELPKSVNVNNERQDFQEILKAFRRCRLAPLVPLHRVNITMVKCPRFPLGKYWREFLLRQEKIILG
jgi:hypothetical protein